MKVKFSDFPFVDLWLMLELLQTRAWLIGPPDRDHNVRKFLGSFHM